MYVNSNIGSSSDIMDTIESTDIYNSSYINSLRSASTKNYLLQDTSDRLDLVAREIYNEPNVGVLIMLNKKSAFFKGNFIRYI